MLPDTGGTATGIYIFDGGRQLRALLRGKQDPSKGSEGEIDRDCFAVFGFLIFGPETGSRRGFKRFLGPCATRTK